MTRLNENVTRDSQKQVVPRRRAHCKVKQKLGNNQKIGNMKREGQKTKEKRGKGGRQRAIESPSGKHEEQPAVSNSAECHGPIRAKFNAEAGLGGSTPRKEAVAGP